MNFSMERGLGIYNGGAFKTIESNTLIKTESPELR